LKSRVFDSLVSYPSSFDIKVVGPGDDPTFRGDIIASVGGVAKVGGTKERVNGKWVSITMTVEVESSEVLYEVYRVIDEDDRVKFKF
jgi:putative lipoic acid-binding regulatory protein